MTTFLDCQNMVTTLLNRRDATAAQIQVWVQNGLQRIQRELRCPAMEKDVTFTVGANYPGGLIIPTDMVELIDLINSRGDRITKQDITTVNQLAGTGTFSTILPANLNIPRFYYRQTNKWLLGPRPVLGDTIECIYYAELAPLSQPGDSNAITIIATDLVAYAALGYAADFFTDRRADRWEARYMQIKDDVQGQGDDDELSGGATVSPAFFYPDPQDGGNLHSEQFSLIP
jgi:hypothetical protein